MQTSGGQILKGLGGVGILGKQTDDGTSSHWVVLSEGERFWCTRRLSSE
jgi:hypothetical protein